MTDIRYTSQDGLSLYARSYGPDAAPLTVLCMHGLTRNHKDFDPMIAALDLPYRFISVDVRGRGQSDRSPDSSTYTPPTYATDMLGLLDHLSLDRVAMIGTSMGGLMAMLMAHHAPERVRGIVLNDIGPVPSASGLKRIAAYAGNTEPADSWDAAAARTAAAQTSAFPDYREQDWFAFAHRTWREEDDGTLTLDYDPEITRTLNDVKPSLVTRIAMWRIFAKLKGHPLLVVRGETSDILLQADARRMIRRHPDAELVTVPGRGHTPMLDEPVAVTAISKFLNRLEAQG